MQLVVQSDINTDGANYMGVARTAPEERTSWIGNKPPLIFDQTFLCFGRPG